jgi:hypothetical protein
MMKQAAENLPPWRAWRGSGERLGGLGQRRGAGHMGDVVEADLGIGRAGHFAIAVGGMAQGEFHVRLPRTQPHIAHQHILEAGRASLSRAVMDNAAPGFIAGRSALQCPCASALAVMAAP